MKHSSIWRDCFDPLRDRLVFRRSFDRCLDRPRRSVRVRRSVWSRLTEPCLLCLSEHFGVVDRRCCLIIDRFSPFIRFKWYWASLTDFLALYNLSLVLAIKSLSWSSWLAIDVELLECFIVGLVWNREHFIRGGWCSNMGEKCYGTHFGSRRDDVGF